MNKQRHLVLPIKNKSVLGQVEHSLYHDFYFGVRNYTIFKTGMTTLLRVSDVLRLTYNDVFDSNGDVRRDTYIKDHKTGKGNVIILKYVRNDLLAYQRWLMNYLHQSHRYQEWIEGGRWLFISSKGANDHFKERPFYFAMQKVGRILGLDYLGTHTMRKTGAYFVYQDTNNISLVMRLLNHSSEAITLHYLGIDRQQIEKSLDSVFGSM